MDNFIKIYKREMSKNKEDLNYSHYSHYKCSNKNF